MPSPESASASASSSLYCDENTAETVADEWISPDFLLNDDNLADLIVAEKLHALEPEYVTRLRPNSDAVAARRDSISWIVRVHGFHRFSPVTAFLSVVFFDRFLSSDSLPSGWPFQLLSVACLSLAAKMEEPRVPLLVDLQVCDPKFVFEPRTVQRMELRVMATLDWRLRAVTPFDFLYDFVSKLTSPSSSSRIFSASSDLILSTTRESDFLGFAPSTVAAAAVIYAAKEVAGEYVETTSFHEKINREMVRSCHQLMEQLPIATCPSSRRKDRPRAEPIAPPSPVGVLDAAAVSSVSGSSDTRSDRAELTPAKRLRSSAPDVQH